jgi:hypothetical protein
MGPLILLFAIVLNASSSAVTRHAAKVYELALDRPDEALKLIFPEGGAEGFTAQSMTWRRHGPQRSEDLTEARSLVAFHMRSALDRVYEAEDTPIVVYAVGNRTVLGGYFRWKGGLMEVFTAMGTDGSISDVYVQRLDGLEKAPFRAPQYRAQFRGLSLSHPLDEAALAPPQSANGSFPDLPTLLAHQRILRAVRWAVLTHKALVRGEWQALRKVAAF